MDAVTVTPPSASVPLVRPQATRWVPAMLFFGALWFVLCRHLSSEWSLNEQYNYGWFVPFFAAYLLWLRWQEKGEIRKAKVEDDVSGEAGTHSYYFLISTFAFLLFLLLPVRLFEIANPDWRPLAWLHAFVVVGITLLFLYSLGGTPWLRHFAFPVLFVLVAVPWISAIEQPIVQGLMNGVAAAAAEVLTWFGIPAQLEGNLIRVSTGLVGVNEACSGVRSLQTSLMIGLLFGELKRLSVRRRLALVCGSLAVAVLANFARAFALVWIAANESVAAVSKWHDIAGYAIVGVVFVATLLLATKLEGRKSKAESDSRASTPTSDFGLPPARLLLPPFGFLLCFLWLVAVEIGCEWWYRSHEWNAPLQQQWTIAWPDKAPAFRDLKIDEGVRGTLRFDEGREVAWAMGSGRCFLYFFRWNPGGSSVVRARAHRPDICLPAAGWKQLRDYGTQEFRAASALEIPFREISFEHSNGQTIAHTFFALHEDRRTTESRPDLSLASGLQPDWGLGGRWRAVREGVRNMGQQVLEVVLLTPREVTDDEAARQFGQMLHDIVRTR